MSIRDFVGPKVLTVGGDRVRVPTVRTFFRALEAFGVEIGSVRAAVAKSKNGLALEVAVAPFLIFPDDGRLEDVLRDLMVGDSWPPADLPGVVLAVARHVAADARRIDALLAPPETPTPTGAEDGVGGDVLMIFGCAEKARVDPMTVADWPIGAFLDAIDAYSRGGTPEAKNDPRAAAVFGSIMPAERAAPMVDGPVYPDAVS